jgi:hypothetical protein
MAASVDDANGIPELKPQVEKLLDTASSTGECPMLGLYRVPWDLNV